MKIVGQALVLIALSICALTNLYAADRPTKTVLVAVDLSDSIRLEHKEGFKKSFRQVLDTMGEGDKLLVVKIAERPATMDSLAMEAIEYGKSGWIDNDRDVRKVRAANLRKSLDALGKFEALLKPTVKETPILEVLQAAPRLLSLYKSERTVIVMLSDMFEFSRTTANFENNKPPFSQKAAEEVFAKIKREGRIPDLKGVTIYVAGARELKDDEKTPVVAASRWGATKWFWTSYFSASGALLGPNAYATDLLRFDEIECNEPGGKCAIGIFAKGLESQLKK
jgi:hypothetical protein